MTAVLLAVAARAAEPAAPAEPAPAEPAPLAPADATPAEAPPVPAEAPPEVDPAEVAAVAAVRLELEAQAAALAAAKADIAASTAALEALRAQLAAEAAEDAAEDAAAAPDTHGVKLAFEGHYRVRGHLFDPLFAPEEGRKAPAAAYFQQRLWLRPRFEFGDAGKLWVELRALEDVVFGDDAGLASTPLFAGDPSNTDLDGNEIPSVTVGRAWGEVKLPVGVFRAGRMPSEWGMGLLVSPGDGFEQPFGEKYYPTTNDRLLFGTRPIAIVQKILGKADSNIPFVVAVAVDRLVEDPLYDFYGYTCDAGVTEGDPRYDARCDSDGDGLSDLDHSYVSDTPQNRGANWWADPDDDVMQMVYVATYQGKGIRYLGDVGDLTGGFWVVNRSQRESDSNVLIVDGTFKSFVHHVLLEGEFVSIAGKTRGIVLPDYDAKDPLRKQASILGYAAKGGYVEDRWAVRAETGFASGDENLLDGSFTGRALHPDHNVGLLIYEQVLANVTAAVRTDAARGLWSNGGVYSSRYLFPTVSASPKEGVELVGGFVAAWPHKPDGAVLLCRAGDPAGCDSPPSLQATADALGWEVDAALKVDWADHFKWSLETGWAKVTDRVPLAAAGLDPKGRFFTLQSRLAWVF